MNHRFAILALTFASLTFAADIDGTWLASWTRGALDRPSYGRLKISAKDGVWTGTMPGYTATLSLTLKGKSVEMSCRDEGKDCGRLTGELAGGFLRLTGTYYGTKEMTFTAKRQPSQAGNATRHEFSPTVFHNTYSSQIAPALTIQPGDTVHTFTVDAAGIDAAGVQRALSGNPLTGPFYVEGAWPGDTLVVKLNRIRLNRNSATTHNDKIVTQALEPWYVRAHKRVQNFDSSWKLDLEKGIGMLANPTERMKNFQVKLAPILGCIGVAPQGAETLRSGRLGLFGGNMDYNQLREGTTVYLPVFHAGALLFLGDGHAAQGDGELTQNALETSMDVEFTVELKERGQTIGVPHAENDEHVMFMGIGNSLEDALQKATTGLSQWLELTYGLNTGEIAMVLGSSMRYDIAEIVDSQIHVAARLAKTVLKPIR